MAHLDSLVAQRRALETKLSGMKPQDKGYWALVGKLKKVKQGIAVANAVASTNEWLAR